MLKMAAFSWDARFGLFDHGMFNLKRASGSFMPLAALKTQLSISCHLLTLCSYTMLFMLPHTWKSSRVGFSD